MSRAIHARSEDIPFGRENALSAEQLSAAWDCNPRAAREAVAKLRAQPSPDGFVICSDTRSAGFWWSNDPEEIRAFVTSMERRAKSTFLALRAARAALEEIEQAKQGRFDLF